MNLLDLVGDDTYDGPELRPTGEIRALFEEERPPGCAIDSESSTFRWWQDRADAFGFSISWGRGRTYYMPVGLDQDFGAAHEVADFLRVVLLTCPIVVFHNAKYDLHVLKRFFDHFRVPLVVRRIEDTMLLSAILDENRHHGLKELTSSMGIEYQKGVSSDALKQEINDWIEEQERATGRMPGYDEAPQRFMVPYAAQDAYLTLALYRRFLDDLEEQDAQTPSGKAGLADTYATEMQLVWVLWQAEERGMRIDLEHVNRKIAEYQPLLEAYRTAMSETLGWDMNPGSTEDVARALAQYGVDDSQWINPRTGKHKMPEWVLEDLDRDGHSIAGMVLEYRTAQKMLTGYYESLASDHKIDELGQAIVRCNFKQMGARTGRTSVTEPPLQTIPRSKGEVRDAFIARAGHKLIFADYKGQELRVLAHYLSEMGDDSMRRVFEAGADLHMETAVAILKKPVIEVVKDERQAGKNTNFAIVYGAGAKKIAAMWGETEEFGKQALTRIYNRFPGLRRMKKSCSAAMETRGYLRTVFGRRHRLAGGMPAYKGLNSLVQGTSAELTKAAMVAIDSAYKRAGLSAMIVLMVHDEVITECPDHEVERAMEVKRAAMIDFFSLSCPLDVDMSVSDRWGDK